MNRRLFSTAPQHFPLKEMIPMPEYRATRFVNTREADTCHFTAGNDQAARDRLLLGNHPGWSGDADLVDCDHPDEVFALDRLCADGSYETVEDEIQLPGEMPYSRVSRQFVQDVAALGEEGAYDDAIETLEHLISLARELCATAQPAEEHPVTVEAPAKA